MAHVPPPLRPKGVIFDNFLRGEWEIYKSYIDIYPKIGYNMR